MKAKSLVAAVVAGALCASCGGSNQNAGKGGGEASRGGTLAGAADTTKTSARKKQQQQGEVRIPVAPIERPPTEQQQVAVGGAPVAVEPTPSQAAAPAAGGAADLSDVPLAPKEAQWTIFCATLGGPEHVETSRQLKQALIQRTGMKEWYILHESGQSRLYYGYYRSIDDPKDKAETARAKADRRKIDELTDGGGERPFKACQFVQLTAPDPESPPQWNLANAPEGMAWTLQVGAYKDSPDRKAAAVEAVRVAREQFGEEAYYYHGEVVSHVCIGAYPEGAVVEERVDPNPQDRKNGRGDILVLPPGVKSPGKVKDKAGRNISAVSQRFVPVDPKLKEKIAKYPSMIVNGEELVYKHEGKEHRRQASLLVQIPRPGAGSSFGENIARAGAGQEAEGGRGLDLPDTFSRPGYADNAGASGAAGDGQPRRPKPAATGAGRLRSIGE